MMYSSLYFLNSLFRSSFSWTRTVTGHEVGVDFADSSRSLKLLFSSCNSCTRVVFAFSSRLNFCRCPSNCSRSERVTPPIHQGLQRCLDLRACLSQLNCSRSLLISTFTASPTAASKDSRLSISTTRWSRLQARKMLVL